MTRHIYFLGIGGTLMGSLAQLAQQMGFSVSGSDVSVYPPMSDQLAAAGITAHEGFDPAQLDPEPDMIVIGNAGLPRGHEAVEYILEKGLAYTSGAQWLGETVLRNRWVLAVAGTHGKTTTASMLAWILEQAGLSPGYLIGGAPKNFEQSARLGESPFFVVEADEYDTSYFDRRSKFVHYRPRTLILNNLEYDHADIFPDIAAIQTQFHNLLRTVPKTGLILAPSNDDHINEVLAMGCWSDVARVGERAPRKVISNDTGEHWQVGATSTDGSEFDVMLNGESQGRVSWPLIGKHNQTNALNAIAAARHAGVPVSAAIDALAGFSGVRRRMELLFENESFALYDDFAHHPTAIRTTLEGLRKQAGSDDIIALIEPRTHTMSLGTLRHELTTCVAAADQVIWYRGENIKWDLGEVAQHCVVPAQMLDSHEAVINTVMDLATTERRRKCHVVIMSNGAFGGIYRNLTDRLTAL
ncbi:MAG: UDP-N-acetylmuramate:L-alanyl-gamma-D-glutamyl-meso-diaminopimelate ligase [Pseudomonadaceae bacterium]|nr:UDP-N-acetylmuramate:L-alanyl-gamma-D-glutamyl-meso-diaminopimelate ligase [Pseudomonadaceae bacterium]